MKIESKVTLLPAYHIPLTCPQKGQTSLELDMSNENNEERCSPKIGQV